MKKYGFILEEYDNGSSIETLQTGDGKSTFSDVVFDDGQVALGLSYGLGKGVGVTERQPDGTLASDVGIKFQVKFESQESIDSMIATLLRLKNQLKPTSEA